MIINGYNVIQYTGQDIYPFVSCTCEVYGTRKNKFVDLGAGFDCETSKIDDKYSFPYVWQLAIGKNVFVCHHNELLLDFLTDLQTIISNEYAGAKLIIWVANLSFEYSFYKSVINSAITKIFARDKRHPLFIDVFKNIQFRECLGVFGYSLENIAKNYTTTQKAKGDLDYNIMRVGGDTPTPLTETEYGYIVNDVAILSELTHVALEKFTDADGKTVLPCTQTGILRNEVKNNLTYFESKNLKNENYNYYTKDKNFYETLRNYLYSGGLTHSLHTAVSEGMHHNITCYDLTSAYPWAFQRYFPCGRIIKAPHKKCISAPHYILHLIYKNLTSKTEHSIISKHKCVNMVNPVLDNGRVYACEYCELWVNEIDFDNISKIYKYDDIAVLDSYYFNKSYKCPDFAKNVMLDYYLKKQVLKEQGLNDTLEYLISKQKVNCCYGMYVTQIYTETKEYDPIEMCIKSVPTDWDKSAKTIFNPFIGYWCTSYVRQRLIEVISKFPDDVIQYDTDSVYCKDNPDLHNFISEINKRITSENKTLISDKYEKCRDLGLWDNDGFYINFRPLGAKRYIGEYDDNAINKKLVKKYFSKGKTPNDFEYYCLRYKITFAGAKDTDIMKQAYDKIKSGVENSEYLFEHVANFDIMSYESTKLVARYFDDTLDTTVSDSYGNKQHVVQNAGTTLVNSTFKAILSDEFFDVHERYNELADKLLM